MEGPKERESAESLISRNASCEEVAAHGWIISRKGLDPCKCEYCESRSKKRQAFAALLGRK